MMTSFSPQIRFHPYQMAIMKKRIPSFVSCFRVAFEILKAGLVNKSFKVKNEEKSFIRFFATFFNIRNRLSRDPSPPILFSRREQNLRGSWSIKVLNKKLKVS